MQFQVTSTSIDQQKTDCFIIAIYGQGQLTPTGQQLDKLSHGYLSQLYQQGDISNQLGKTTLLHNLTNLPGQRVLVVGCGDNESLAVRHFLKALDQAYAQLSTFKLAHAVSSLSELCVAKHDIAWKIQQEIVACDKQHYQFNTYKSQKVSDESKANTLAFTVANQDETTAKTAVTKGQAVAQAIKLTKDLANTPPNVCTPAYLAEQAEHIAGGIKRCKVNILDEAEMEKLGMESLLAVGRGSARPSKLICVHYQGADKQQAPIALVGKGVTFDTGGINLKAMLPMVGMKYDMCGAATMLGILQALIQLQLPINVVIVIAAVENMPGGRAITPNTIVKSMQGKTIEIMNTDAEGRLILADALTYCQEFKPKCIIDVATLTGAVIVSLGKVFSGLLANDQTLADQLLTASQLTHDRAWQLPYDEDYLPLLKSEHADISNMANAPEAGTISAGCFLGEFVKDYPWAHLDVAGTAFNKQDYATGRPVSLLMQFLFNQAEA